MNSQESIRFEFEQGEELLHELNNCEGISIELAKNMKSEMNQLQQNSENILLVGTEGTKTVTIFLAPQHVVKGVGPVLVPTFDSQRIVSMVSKEYIETRAAELNESESQDAAQQDWNTLLDHLFNTTVDLASGS